MIDMRNANGFGSVYKLSGKRRKPWIARKTKGWAIDEESGKAKQLYATMAITVPGQKLLLL